MHPDFIPLTEILLAHVIQQQGHTLAWQNTAVTATFTFFLTQAGAHMHANTNWACL